MTSCSMPPATLATQETGPWLFAPLFSAPSKRFTTESTPLASSSSWNTSLPTMISAKPLPSRFARVTAGSV